MLKGPRQLLGGTDIDAKLAFCVHEYTVNPAQTVAENTDIKKFLSYVYADTHPSKYTSSSEKR